MATPQLVRLDYARGMEGLEPTLLVKGSTLLLKYIVLGTSLQFTLGRIDDRLLYTFIAYDDASKPAMFWSIVETEAEVNALSGIASDGSCPIFLFNELALNVARSAVEGHIPHRLLEWINNGKLGSVDYSTIAQRVDDLLGAYLKGTVSSDEFVAMPLVPAEPWHPLYNHYVTSHGADSPIDLFSRDEGGQQEQLASQKCSS